MAINKIKKRAALKKILEKKRKEGKKIVMTNGVFDLLHVGHVRFLEATKELGDILVVAINSDKSTKRFKGPLRPILPEDERAEVIAGLHCVDYTLIFSETTARRTIKELKPEIYTKGGEHKIENIVEVPLVKSYGGEVKIVLPKFRSVTDIVKKILETAPLKYDQNKEYELLHKSKKD